MSVENVVAIIKYEAVYRGNSVHDVYVWSITSGMYALSAHVQTANLPVHECEPILHELEAILRDKYRIRHATFQFERDWHEDKCSEVNSNYCDMSEVADHNHDHDH